MSIFTKTRRELMRCNSDHEAVTYDPPSAWNSQDFCPHSPCFATPDVTRIQDGTWHESTFHAKSSHANDFANQLLSATTIFHGNAVYVYAVLPLVNGTLPSTSAVSFILDGESTGPFSYNSGPDYTYDFLVFVKTGLSPGSHNITIVNGELDGKDSLFILDRIVYSTTSDGSITTTEPEVSSQPITLLPEPHPTQSTNHSSLSSFSSQTSVGPEATVPTPSPGGSTTSFSIPETPLGPVPSHVRLWAPSLAP
ncbi:hypothetical protein BDZ94DRAFT_1297651 [Collybia nuda]|uniref:Uncharacterized protein n=1 Tax=Collybia nuda TaxID=64659 RepID=A0A9P5Y8Q6_9AGAR|nr:hypothetical protein BDZ94DRAFT_1297651 [Collybia nuda]